MLQLSLLLLLLLLVLVLLAPLLLQLLLPLHMPAANGPLPLCTLAAFTNVFLLTTKQGSPTAPVSTNALLTTVLQLPIAIVVQLQV